MPTIELDQRTAEQLNALATASGMTPQAFRHSASVVSADHNAMTRSLTNYVLARLPLASNRSINR